MAGIPSGDKLVLRGLQFHGYHGVYEAERKLGQKFVVDADVWTDLSVAGETDDLADSISYAAIYKIIQEIVQGPSKNLVESLASSITKEVFSKFPTTSCMRVRVKKPQVSVEGIVDYLGVEIVRHNQVTK